MKFEKILLYTGKKNEHIDKAKSTVKSWAESNHIPLTTISGVHDLNKLNNELEDKSIVLSLGGDGTFLRAADLISPFQLPILGINLGQLGFLSGLDYKEIQEGLTSVFEGEFEIEKLSRLRCQISNEEIKQTEECTALNEIVVSRGNVSSFAEIELFLNSTRVATYPGDGIIVATPTGSTAYSLSSGGPLITRDTPAFTITPLNVHQLGLIPIICSDESQIALEAKTKVITQVDGHNVGKLKDGERVKIAKSSIPTLMVVPHIRSGFFETVRNKLNWGLNRGI